MSWNGAMRFAFSMQRNQITPKKAVTLVTALLALYTIARIGVLFFEAIATVREERSQDHELLLLCARGDAKSSPKMRDACLRARADTASPLLAKAILYAVSTAFKDFSSSIGSPFKAAVLCLFVLSSIVLPLLPWARALFGSSAHGSHLEGSSSFGMMNPNHFIVMAPSNGSYGSYGSMSRGSRWRRKLGRHIPMLRSKPSVHEEMEDPFADDYDDTRSSNVVDMTAIHLHED